MGCPPARATRRSASTRACCGTARAASFSSVEQFARICLERLLAELEVVTALEVFSMLYALVEPWDALDHALVFALLDECCLPHRRRARLRTLRARPAEQETT